MKSTKPTKATKTKPTKSTKPTKAAETKTPNQNNGQKQTGSPDDCEPECEEQCKNKRNSRKPLCKPSPSLPPQANNSPKALRGRIRQLENTNLTSANASTVADFAKSLASVVARASQLNRTDLDRTVNQTASLVAHLKSSPSLLSQVLKNVTETIGHLANVSPNQLSSAGAGKLLATISNLTSALNATASGTVEATDLLALGCVAVSASTSSQLGFSVPSGGSVREAQIRIGSGLEGASVEIRVQSSDVQSDRVDFSLLPSDGLFRAMQSSASRQVVSHVIAARTDLRAIATERAFGAQPVQLVFSFNASPNASERPQCMFWNFNTSRWDGTGCRPLKSLSASGKYACECSHLTNFALLFTPDGSPSLSNKLQHALTAVTYFILALSCFALLATIVIYILYARHLKYGQMNNRNSYRVSLQAGRILASLCAALLAGHIVFLAGSHHQKSDAGCTVIGALLHFCYLSAFSWSVVEGVNIFLSFVFLALSRDRLSADVSHFFLKASALAWGVPAGVVVVTLAVNASGNYGLATGSEDQGLCFLRPIPFYCAFMAPFLLCLAVNLVVLGLLSVALWHHGRSKLRQNSKDGGKRVVGFIGICVLLNVTWALGAVQTAAPHEVTMFLFVIVNGLQGVFIFVFYCLLRQDVRQFLLGQRLDSFGSRSGQVYVTPDNRSMSCTSFDTKVSKNSDHKLITQHESEQELSEIHVTMPPLAVESSYRSSDLGPKQEQSYMHVSLPAVTVESSERPVDDMVI